MGLAPVGMGGALHSSILSEMGIGKGLSEQMVIISGDHSLPETPAMSHFSHTLSREISKRGLTVYEVKKRMGNLLSVAFLYRLTSGEKRPSPNTIRLLADALVLTEDQELRQDLGMDPAVDRNDPEWIRVAWKLTWAAMLDGSAKSKRSWGDDGAA